MTDRVWYTAVGGTRQGPMPEADLRDQIARGTVNSETLVWNDTMTEWTKAGNVSGLIPPGAPPPPPARASAIPSPDGQQADGGQTGAPLGTSAGTWPLFGRFLLVVIGQIFVIPAPWVWTSFYRWFIDSIELPNGRKVSFEGKVGDIWWVFILSAIFGFAGVFHEGAPLLLLPLTTLFSFMIIRWLFANLRWEGQHDQLRFAGSYWGLLGWMAFLYVSLISIIGWAWVTTAATRWYCRNVEGTHEQLSFVASGWGVLWRTLLLVLACSLLIPIPWAMAWYVRWIVSQFHLSPRTA